MRNKDTLALLDKYQKLLGGLIDIHPSRIEFHRDDKLIGELLYEKPLEEVPEGEDQINYNNYNGWKLGEFKAIIRKDDNSTVLVASFKLYEMPHCCGIMVSCRACVERDFRRKRVGTLMNNLRQEIGRGLGYSTILCTDIEQNKAQRRILQLNGWKDIHSLRNKRTGNKIFISVIDI